MQQIEKSPLAYLKAWLVHIFTALGGIFALLGIYYIHMNLWINAFWMLSICLFIDSIDGTLARKFHVKSIIPQIDGALLDNLIDYVAYVIAPAFFILAKGMLPDGLHFACVSLLIIASSYQFTQKDAKTTDNFFKGFPCYWNITVFYMFIVDGSKLFNLSVLLLLIALVFVPIKYIYLSRMEYATNSPTFQKCIYIATVLFSISSLILLTFYPDRNNLSFYSERPYYVIFFTSSISYSSLSPSLSGFIYLIYSFSFFTFIGFMYLYNSGFYCRFLFS